MSYDLGRVVVVVLLAIVLAPSICAAETTQTSGDDGLTVLPSARRLLSPLLADPHEAQTRVKVGVQRNGPTLLDVTFGDDLVLARAQFSADHAIDLSVRGFISARFAVNRESFPLQSSEFFGGIAGGYQYGENTFELFFFHQSSHLGDEPLDFGERQRIDFSRDSLRLLWSRWFGDLRLYVGPVVDLDPGPRTTDRRMRFQWGGEYYFDLLGQRLYAAADCQLLEVNDWSVNLNGQIGWFLRPEADHPFQPRVFVEVFTGHSTFGQFWNESETNFMVGLASSL